MGVIFAIIFFLSLLVIGIIGIIAGIIGLIIGIKRKKAGKPLAKVLIVIFAIVLSIGIVTALIPVGFFTFIVIINSAPPDNFVKTDIVIEEDGYQDTRFTADGVVYEVLDFYVNNTDAISNPIFTYKTAGFLNGSQCGNYYAIDNSQGFHLVSDNFGLLFSPIDEKELVIEHYTDLANLCGYYDNWNGYERKFSDDENQVIQDFLIIDIPSLHQEKIILENAEDFEIKLVCKEELVYVESYWFLVLNNKLYYVYDTDFADDSGIEYTLIELPTEIAHALLNIHKNI